MKYEESSILDQGIYITLKEYLDTRAGDLRCYIDAKFDSIEKEIQNKTETGSLASKVKFDALEKNCENKFNSINLYIDSRFDSSENATKLAADTLSSRLEHMNEFRESMKDQTKEYITRREHDALISKYDAEVARLSKSQNIMEGKASMSQVYIGYIVGFIGIIIAVAGLLTQGI